MPDVVEITGDKVIERDFTAAERAQHEADLAEGAALAAAAQKAAADAASAKASGRAKLAALGLNDDEINALLGA